MIDHSDPLHELRQLQHWYAAGLIGAQEFAAMYRDLDRSSAKALCDNGDGRVAVVQQGGKALCGQCAGGAGCVNAGATPS